MDVLDTLPNTLGLTRLELASGYVGGAADKVEVFAPTNVTPRVAVERAILDAFEAGPVCVAFSGGRDSSVILAAATHVARRDGFPDPVPVTQRFPRADGADENRWQEMVVAHLGLKSWQVLNVHDEVDLLGDIALSIVRQHGPLFPSFGHQLVPMYRAAAGAVLLTGEGGDEFFDDRRSVVARQQAGRFRRRPTKPAMASLVYTTAPRSLRARRGTRDAEDLFGWIQPEPRVEAIKSFSDWAAEEPFVWRQYLRWVTSQRLVTKASAAARMVAESQGAHIMDVLYQPAVLSALAQTRPIRGFRDRTAAYVEMFGSLLPRAALTRQTKAVFNQVTLGPRMRSFADAWDGTGLDSDLVDVDELRLELGKPTPSSGALALLQVAYLSTIA